MSGCPRNACSVLYCRQLTHISDIDFSYFPADCVEMGGVRNGGSFEEGPNKVTVHFSRRNPAERLSDPGKLLVAMYPWDGNSFPGTSACSLPSVLSTANGCHHRTKKQGPSTSTRSERRISMHLQCPEISLRSGEAIVVQ